jgi:hypothetical protein
MAKRINGSFNWSVLNTNQIIVTYTPVAGNGMVGVVTTKSNSTVTSVVQTNCTWTFVRAKQLSTTARVEIWYCAGAGASPGTTITANLSASNRGVSMLVEEYNPGFVGTVLDVANDSSDSGKGGAGVTINSGTTAATTQASELWVCGAYSDDGANGFTQTMTAPTNGFAVTQSKTWTYVIATIATAVGVALIDKIVTATAGSASVAVTSGGYDQYAAEICCLRFADPTNQFFRLLSKQ